MAENDENNLSQEPLLTVDDGTQTVDNNAPVSGQSTFLGALLLLLNTTIGSGTLLIPYCYRCGLALCLGISFIMAIIALCTLFMLIDCWKVTGARDYTHLFEISFGRKWTWIMNIWIVLILFGTVIIYVSWIGRLVKDIIPLHGVPWDSPIFWNFMCAIFLIFPLTIFRSLKMLESWSGIAVFFIIWLIVFALYWFIEGIVEEGFTPEKIEWFNPGKIMISTFGIMSMAYDCHCNIFQTLRIFKNPTVKRSRLLTIVVVFVSFFMYNGFGLFAYLHLFDQLGPGAALEYYPKNWFTIVTTIGVIIILILGGPMMVFPTRNSFIDLVFHREVNNIWWNVIGASIVLLATACACLSNNIVFFFDLVGGLLTPGFVFTLPAIFYLKNVPKLKIYHKIIAGIVIIMSIAATCACTYNVLTGD